MADDGVNFMNNSWPLTNIYIKNVNPNKYQKCSKNVKNLVNVIRQIISRDALVES